MMAFSLNQSISCCCHLGADSVLSLQISSLIVEFSHTHKEIEHFMGVLTAGSTWYSADEMVVQPHAGGGAGEMVMGACPA